jgi:hypothetical protein
MAVPGYFPVIGFLPGFRPLNFPVSASRVEQ